MLCLVKPHFCLAKQLPATIRFSHGVGIVGYNMQTGMAEFLQGVVHPAKGCEHLTSSTATTYYTYRKRMLRIQNVIVYYMSHANPPISVSPTAWYSYAPSCLQEKAHRS